MTTKNQGGRMVVKQADGSLYLKENEGLRWFDKFPACRECGKSAAGILKGTRNESHGHHCAKCAEKRLKNSEQVRKELAAIEAEAV